MKIKEYFSGRNHWHLNYYRAIHSIKTAIACLIGIAIQKYYDLPSGQWIPITTMVVMSTQTHFGGTLRKAYMRLLGTISGITITIAVLWLFGDDIEVIFCTILVAIIIFTYVANSNSDINYAGTLGGVTVILTLTGQNVGMEIAIQRGFYIVIGVVIAILTSRILLPIHARDRFRYHVATTLRNLQKLYCKAVEIETVSEQKNIDAKLENDVAADIATQPRLINEAAAGSLDFANKKIFFKEIVNSEHQLNRLISLTHCSLQPPTSIKEHLAIVADLHIVIKNSLDYLANCFENKKQPQAMIDLKSATNEIMQLVETLPKNSKTYKIITEYSFIFFMEQILKELENMKELIKKVNGKNNSNMI